MTAQQALLGCVMFACGVLAASLAAGKPAQEIKHAPTVEQCQADGRLWFSKLEDSLTSSVSYNTLVDWSSEMRDSSKVDSVHHDLYDNVVSEAIGTIVSRYVNFVQRHHLYEQFVAEDEAGVGR
jgi:hypothetical protein